MPLSSVLNQTFAEIKETRLVNVIFESRSYNYNMQNDLNIHGKDVRLRDLNIHGKEIAL